MSDPRSLCPAIVTLEGWSLQLLEPIHAPIVVELLARRGHRYLLDVPMDAASIASLLELLPREPWSLPLAVIKEGECVGVATTALPSIKSLNASLMTMFVDPPSATTPLAMCVRHLFWNFPLHRVYCQVPLLDLTREYVDLLMSVGFQDEGRLVDHAMIGGQRFDVAALGLTRHGFDDWCDAHEPRLRLT